MSRKFKISYNIKIMNKLLENSIFVMFGGRFYHQTVSIPLGTNCAPLVKLVLFAGEADFT